MFIWRIEKTSRKDKESTESSVVDLMPIFGAIRELLARDCENLAEMGGKG
ncbi:MAG: hypothetical protein IKB01_11750 [Lachnospiraceae bacterium]|nr:hypothetical protein [Lachnospiraceae bacterium]